MGKVNNAEKSDPISLGPCFIGILVTYERVIIKICCVPFLIVPFPDLLAILIHHSL